MIKAKYIMTKGTAVRTESSADDVLSRLWATGLCGVPVTNDLSEVVGVVTETNLLGAMTAGAQLGEITAGSIMTKDPLTADVDTPNDDLSRIMLSSSCPIILIVKDKKLVGVVGRSALMEAYVSRNYEVFEGK